MPCLDTQRHALAGCDEAVSEGPAPRLTNIQVAQPTYHCGLYTLTVGAGLSDGATPLDKALAEGIAGCFPEAGE